MCFGMLSSSSTLNFKWSVKLIVMSALVQSRKAAAASNVRPCSSSALSTCLWIETCSPLGEAGTPSAWAFRTQIWLPFSWPQLGNGVLCPCHPECLLHCITVLSSRRSSSSS
jgi:hypothetical protein